MKEEMVAQRFAALISDLGITKNAFAKSLGRTATVVQHLLDGRNKPGFDLLETLFTVYPNVSKDWIMLGKGPRYYNSRTPNTAATPQNSQLAATAEPTAEPVPEIAPQLIKKTAPKQADLPPTPAVESAASTESVPAAEQPSTPETPAAVAPAAAPTTVAPADTSWQTALYTQQMAHQLAMAELRNQHLQEQQRLMQQMLDLMQRKSV